MNPTKKTPGVIAHRGLLMAAVALFGGALAFGGLFDRATAEGPADGEASSSAASMVFSSEQKTGIEVIVREYLLANPEIFLEVQTELEKRLEHAQAERMKTAIKSNAKDLYQRTDAPMAGDPNGDITVVEFFDYNCGYCKRGFSQLSQLIDNDKKVRVVFKELPILSKGSEDDTHSQPSSRASIGMSTGRFSITEVRLMATVPCASPASWASTLRS